MRNILNSNTKIFAVLFMIAAIVMPALSFAGGDLPGIEKADLYLTSPTGFEVDQSASVTVNFYYINTWGTGVSVSYGALCYDASGTVVKTISKTPAPDQVSLFNSYTFTAPDIPGSYNAKIVWTEYITHPTYGTTTYSATTNIPFTVTGPPPAQYYTLTTIVNDDAGAPVSSADISIDSGSLGTTDTGGMLSVSVESGSYIVTATKVDYISDSEAVVLTTDKIVNLILTIVPEPTPTPTPTPTEEPTAEPNATVDPNATATPEPTPTETPIPYTPPAPGGGGGEDPYIPPVEAPPTTYDLFLTFKSEDDAPLSDVKTSIDGVIYESDADGKVTIFVTKDTTIGIVSTKDGYNRYQQEVEMDSDKSIIVTMTPSMSGFFTSLGFESFNENPFYDPDGLFGQIPYFVVVGSVISMAAGAFLFSKP